MWIFPQIIFSAEIRMNDQIIEFSDGQNTYKLFLKTCTFKMVHSYLHVGVHCTVQ